MRIKFIDPQQIMGAVLALLILGIGVFASFTVFANIPASTPVSSSQRLGNGTLFEAAAPGLLTNTTDPILRWIPAPGFLNNTGVCQILAEGTAGISGGFDAWYVLQAIGSVNGTFCANGTMRVGHIVPCRNSSLRLEYALAGQQTTNIENSTFTAVINVSQTSTQVFNIIGVVLVLAAIMSIVGLVYSYVRPRM